MESIGVAMALLLAGAVLALALRDNRHRAWASLSTQTLAAALVLWRTVPILLSGSGFREAFPWSYPIDAIPVHLDALGAFFLSWSLPLTLLGSIYAVGYLRP